LLAGSASNAVQLASQPGPKPVDCSNLDSPKCPRASLVYRTPAGNWSVQWKGGPGTVKGSENEVRGIASLPTGNGISTWFVTLPQGIVRRADAASGVPPVVTQEATLRDLAPSSCNDFFYGYQIYVHQRGDDPSS
jgi:hypothetical protein